MTGSKQIRYMGIFEEREEEVKLTSIRVEKQAHQGKWRQHLGSVGCLFMVCVDEMKSVSLVA